MSTIRCSTGGTLERLPTGVRHYANFDRVEKYVNRDVPKGFYGEVHTTLARVGERSATELAEVMGVESGRVRTALNYLRRKELAVVRRTVVEEVPVGKATEYREVKRWEALC